MMGFHEVDLRSATEQNEIVLVLFNGIDQSSDAFCFTKDFRLR